MAIIDPKNSGSLRLTVTLRDGTVLGPADTTSSPFGQSERIVAIWVGDTIAIYPIELVAKVEMQF